MRRGFLACLMLLWLLLPLAVQADSVTLAWDAAVPNAWFTPDGYAVQRQDTPSGAFVEVGRTAVTVLTYTDHPSPGQTLMYRVVATAAGQQSAPSNVVTVRLPAPPPPIPPRAGWTACAIEDATCAFTGAQEVQYGAGSTWVAKILSNGTPCTNATFSDPLPGVLKYCYRRDVPPQVSPPPRNLTSTVIP